MNQRMFHSRVHFLQQVVDRLPTPVSNFLNKYEVISTNKLRSKQNVIDIVKIALNV